MNEARRIARRPSSRTLHPSRGRVATVSVVMALALLGDSLLYVVLPLHAPALGLSAFQVGVLLSANRWVRMLTNTGAARLMRRFAPGPPFAAATALASLTTALYALTPGFPAFLLARFAWGLCYSTLRLGCFFAVLGVATDRTRGRLMGIYQSISRSGSFAAVMAGGALFDAFGYRAAVLTMAAGTALAVPLALRGGPRRPAARGADAEAPPSSPAAVGAPDADATASARRDDRDQQPGVPGPAGTPAQPPLAAATGPGDLLPAAKPRWPAPSRLLAVKWSGFALAFVARGVATATLALFLKRAFGTGFGPGGAIGVATLASWLIGVRWASDIGLATPLGALSDRVGRARAATGWLLAVTAAVLALAIAPAVGVAVAAAVLLFVAASGLGATLDAAAGDLAPPHRRAEVMSSYADWTDIGAALGPLLALTVADRLGLRPVYAAGAVLLALGAGAVWLAFGAEHGRPPAVRGQHTRLAPMAGDDGGGG